MTKFIILCFILLILTSCQVDKEKGSDSTTQATPEYKLDTSMTLPVPSETYDVLGFFEGLKHFVVRYDSSVIRGGEFYSNMGVKSLRSLNVKTIISITPNDAERFICNLYGFKLVEIPFEKKLDLSNQDLEKLFKSLQNDHPCFYIHSIDGTHRVGALACAYRIHVLGWSSQQAIEEFERCGGDVSQDDNMIQRIINYKVRIEFVKKH